jgi:hypothetical protein
MMDMTDRIFAVDDITLHDLEDHLNELASDNWVLYSIHNPGTTESALPYFVVIAHRPHDWEAAELREARKMGRRVRADKQKRS